MPVLSHPEHRDEPVAHDATSSNAMPVTAQPSASELVDERPVHQVSTAPIAAPPQVTDESPPPRRRWPWIVGGLVVVGAGAVAALLLLGGDGESTDAAAAPTRTARTATAETRDLVEFEELDGRMVYADTLTVGATVDGVVTDVVTEGSTVSRGDTLLEINANPVTLFYGEVPLYRDLAEGSTGDDVEMLEANLASLGYHTVDDEDGEMVDTGFVVDGVYDAATTQAVARWQDDVGASITGTVSTVSAVVADGSSVVSDVSVATGDRVGAGQPLMALDPLESTDAFYAEHAGDLELLVERGQEILSGDVLYEVDDLPVVALVTTIDIERDLGIGVEPGDDIEAVEQMLFDLGYDADDDLDVDDEFTAETTEAIIEFEEDLQDGYDELVPDGVLTLSEFVLVDPFTVVGSIDEYDSETLASGTQLWSNTDAGGRRIVETEIAVADQQQLPEGAEVGIEFPSGEVVSGFVTDVASSSTVDPMDPDAEPVLAVEIELASVPESVAALNELDVEVLLVDEIAQQVTVVPASALVSLGDGQFAVEAVTQTGTTLVAVEPGLFADGFVEVAGLQVGAQVVIPG